MYMVARNRRTRQRRSKQRKTRRQRGGETRGGEARLKIPTGCNLLEVTDAKFATNTLNLLNSQDDACVASAWEQYLAISKGDKKKIKNGTILFNKAALEFYELNKKLTQHARTYNSD
jgi:hypothetical protein